MASIASLIVMFSTPVISCADYDIHSDVQGTYNEEVVQAIAEEMALLIQHCGRGIHIASDEVLDEQLDDVMRVNNNAKKQQFRKDIAEHLIREMTDNLVFSTTYLRSKDTRKKTGEIEVVYIHSPFNHEENKVEPMVIDGFTVQVKLPYYGETFGIENKICSPAAAKYLHHQWLRKIPLHVRTVVSIIEKANNMSLPSNNQGIEGMTNKEKNKNRDVRLNTSEPGTYFWYRYLGLHRGSKVMMAQMDRCEEYVKHRRD